MQAVSVQSLGWAGTKNGELLRHAVAAGFDVFVTMDRNLRHQQDLTALSLGAVLVRAPSTRLADLLPLAPVIVAAVATVTQASSGRLPSVRWTPRVG